MTVNGVDISLFEGFEVSFGESLVYTEKHLLRHKKRAKKEYSRDDNNLMLAVKNIPLYGIPAKCYLEYNNKDKLQSISFKVAIVDYRACKSPDDVIAAANELSSYFVNKMQDTFGCDENIKTSVGLTGAPISGVVVKISSI